MDRIENSLLRLRKLGQAVWLDMFNRHLLINGTLSRLIEQDGLAGLIIHPATFQEAVTQDSTIENEAQRGHSALEIYKHLIIEDIRAAVDCFRPLYDRSGGQEGLVSLEIPPRIAYDTEATINEARRLWQLIERPNALIAIPGTKAGLPAMTQLISEGININVTLLFSVGRYLEIANAYMAGLEKRLAENKPIDHIASVASFFLSRIDLKVDRLLDEKAQGGEPRQAKAARELRGKAALASAGFAYERFQELYAQPRWQALAAQGARKQRLLWAATASEDPLYSDIKYVEALIGPETISALSMATLEAYREHGQPEVRIGTAVHEASKIMHRLAELNIDLRIVDEGLETEGIRQLSEPYEQLLATLGRPWTQTPREKPL